VMPDWRLCRATGDSLLTLAGQPPSSGTDGAAARWHPAARAGLAGLPSGVGQPHRKRGSPQQLAQPSRARRGCVAGQVTLIIVSARCNSRPQAFPDGGSLEIGAVPAPTAPCRRF